MCSTIASIVLSAAALASAASTQVGVNNKVDGDQTVGGVHLFELHSPQGGIGLGFKILFLLAIVAVIIYWYIRRRTRQTLLRHPALRQAAAYAAAPAFELAQVHPQPPVVCPAPGAHHVDKDSSSGFRLP